MAKPDFILSRSLLVILPIAVLLLIFPMYIFRHMESPGVPDDMAMVEGSGDEEPLRAQNDPSSSTLEAGYSGRHSPKYEIGLGYVTANRSLGTEKGWAKVSEAAHVAYIQRKWSEWDSKQLVDDIETAKRKGLKIYLAFETLANDRKKLKLPDGLEGDFSSAKVRERYLKTVVGTAREMKPDYFIVNVEANLYKKHNPKDYKAYKDFYPQVYREIKKVSPETKVAVSVTYSDYNGKGGIDGEDKAEFRRLVNDFDRNLDMLAVSIYPFSFLRPSAIPVDFLKEVGGYSEHPLFIAETGWVSQDFRIKLPGMVYHFKSSPQVQAEFVERMRLCADYASDQGTSISAINYVSLIDVGLVGRKAIQMALPFFEWFCYLALMEPSGEAKPAFGKMVEWKARLGETQGVLEASRP